VRIAKRIDDTARACFDISARADCDHEAEEVALQKRLLFFYAFSLLLSANAFAQDAPVTDCDTYAANDQDPQRKANGVPLAKLNPAVAMPACEAAVRQFPNSGRLAYQLGRAYYKANNYDAAVTQLRKAAEQSYAGAQNSLGFMYLYGQGVPQDYGQALMWYRKAVEQGYAPAQNSLGFMYQNGHGIPQDYAQALMWYRKAAEQGDARARINLGFMYQNGQGVPQDYVQAVMWYRKAAEQGSAIAQNNLGLMYQNGQGVPQDYVQAVMWYRKAAEQGYAGAQNNLGAMHANGRGIQSLKTWKQHRQRKRRKGPPASSDR
jgi:TPR repeat protein